MINEERVKLRKSIAELASKDSKSTVVTFPDGREERFSSSVRASRVLGGSMNLVLGWISKGAPKSGKWKGYSARYER